MALVIKYANGIYTIDAGTKGNGRGLTLEGALAMLDSGAPDEIIHAAAELIDPFVGHGHEQISEGVQTA